MKIACRAVGARIVLPAVLAAMTAMAAAAPIRVGTTSSSSDAPLFIAEKKGYFRQEGLQVEFTPFDSAAKMIAPLGTGQLEVGAGSPAAGFFNAAARNLNIKIVADKGSMPPGHGYLAILVRKDLVDGGKYQGYADFKGMKVALPAPGTTTDGTLNEALKRGGLKWSDVEVTHLGFPQHVIAFQNKAIDAAVTTEPSATRAEQLGVAVRVGGGDQVFPNQQVATILYSADFIKARPDDARKFMRAYLKAARDYNDALKDGRLAGPSADEIVAILTEMTNIKDPKVYRAITSNGVNPDGKINEESLRKDLQFFRERGLIEGTITVEQVVDNSFVEWAVKDLGPYKPKR
jgi:NitT/TauT family transport system substrate-binding protein